MNWFTWALLSAFFAGLTAVLAKVGVAHVNSNLATAIRTVVILLFAWSIALFTNNWSISKEIPAAYKERSITVLAARAAQAFHEMYPMRESIVEPGLVYRTLSYGPHLDVFMLDERSYRGPNGPNLQATYGPDSYFLGPAQLAWLKREIGRASCRERV